MSHRRIAIIGMAGRFPGASTVAAFWESLLRGQEQGRDCEGPAPGADGNGSFVARSCDLAGIEYFDAGFFGFTPQEARVMDPQHRVFLECAFEACEDAGLTAAAVQGRVGVFASSSMSTYLLNNLLKSSLVADSWNYQALIGNDKDFVATRVSYKLNFTGPSLAVQSACSSSLVAAQLACAALINGDCEAALAGGVSISVPQGVGYTYKEGGILARDGHCRPFDDGATGTIKGNGCGVVVLKRLDAALAAGDQIYAVIEGGAVRNDGNGRAGFTAPSPAGQAATIAAALAMAGIPVSQLGYVEAHGTGTSLGDPIEVRALTRAHQASSEPPARCYLGSVKANIGHLDAAAGVVGLMKAALVLRHNRIPAQINLQRLNRAIALDEEHYAVATETTVPETPLQAAAVSSFGLGGTNAHCILTAPPALENDLVLDGQRYLIPLSAKTPAALRVMQERLRDALLAAPTLRICDIAFTLHSGRNLMPHRWACLVGSTKDLQTELSRQLTAPSDPTEPAALAWMAGNSGPDVQSRLGNARRVSLPTYPFARDRHWVEPEAQHAAQTTAPASEPGSSILDETLQIVRETLNLADLAASDDMYALGCDSLAAVDIVCKLRERLGVDLTFSSFESLRTAAEIAAHVEAHIGQSARALSPELEARAAPAGQTVTSPAVPSRLVRAGTGLPIFLFPPAGGTCVCYYQLANHLKSGRPIYVQPLADDADSAQSLRTLAERFVASIEACQPDGPYTLAGYSFGGNVAFEAALQLEKRGREVAEVFMFDSFPPESYVGRHCSEQDVVSAFPLLLNALFGSTGRADSETTRAALASIDDVLAERVPAGSSAGTLGEYQRFFRIWKQNHYALKRYYPDGRLRARLNVFEASEWLGGHELDLLQIGRLDRRVWQGHAETPLRITTVTGDHYSMFVDPNNLAALAAAWDLLLIDAEQPSSPEGAAPSNRREP